MKKHIIRILTVLCMFCLGAALFVGCKPEEEKPDDTPTTYTVTYAANGGTGTAPAVEKYKEGETFKVKENPFTKDGSTFKTWNDGSKDYAPGATYTMPKKNVTFTAQWESNEEPTPQKEKVTVTFALGDHSDGTALDPVQTNKDEEYTLPAGPAAAKADNFNAGQWTGYVFDGWKIGETDDVKKAGEKITPSANVTLTAQWREVHFEISGASLEATDSVMYVVVTGLYTGFTDEEFIAAQEDANDHAVYISVSLGTSPWTAQKVDSTTEAEDGEFSVKLDVTALEKATPYAVLADGSGYGDIKTLTVEESKDLGDKKYSLNGGSAGLILTIGDAGKGYAFTGMKVEAESDKVYLTVSGTYSGYTDTEFKGLLEDEDEKILLIDLCNGTTWAWQGLDTTITATGGTFEAKINVTSLEVGTYSICENKGGTGDIKWSEEYAGTITKGGKKYTIERQWAGNTEIKVEAATEPEPPEEVTFSEPTSATLEVIKSDGRETGKLFREEVDAAFLVLKGTYTGAVTEEMAQDYFSQGKYSFMFTKKEWKDRLRRISIDTSAKTWTVKFDVTSLPVGDNKCVLKNVDLKLAVGADATNTVKSLGSTFTLKNIAEGVLAVNVKHNYTISGVDLAADTDGTPRLIMTGTYEEAVWSGEEIKKFLLDDDVRTLCLNLGTYVWPMNDYYSADVTATGGTFTVKLDISCLSARTDDLVLSEGSGYGDIAMADISKEISTANKKFTLKTYAVEDESGKLGKVVLTVELLAGNQTWAVTQASIAAESEKVYITVNGTHSGYTPHEFKALLEDVNHSDLAFRVFLFGGDWATQDTPPVYTVAEGTFSVKFDITSLPNGTFGIGKDWGGYGDIKTVNGTWTAELGNRLYTLKGTADNLTVEIKTNGTLSFTSIDIEADTTANKVYLTITGTFTGYSEAELKALLEGDIDGHKYFSFWGNTVRRENPASIVVTVDGSNWIAKCDVTDLQVDPLRNIGCPGDTLSSAFSTEITNKSVTLGNKKYTLQKANGWGNIGLAVEAVEA